ncbi:MAG: glycosyltransferase family 2 protein [Prevotella sp.]|nr:glycosyltransferase family 2 protein [Prevotella sp.]
MKIAVLITCFNRKEKTIKCLQSLKNQLDGTNIEYDIHLTDDGCTDGTAKAVLEECPSATIYNGGNLYWAGGMRLCWMGAVKKGGYDYYLLLNDDTYVNDFFVSDFIECHRLENGNAVICGNTCDPITKKGTYVFVRLLSYFPYRTKVIGATGKPEYDGFCGANIMWIPDKIVKRQGIIPKIYVHSIADNDICMRAMKNGFKVMGTSHYCGYCIADHHGLSTTEMQQMGIIQRWHWLWSPKGASMKQWIYFQWKFFPWRLPGVIIRAMYNILFGIGVR